MGSATAILLAIYLGLRATLLIGGALYLAALAVVWLKSASPMTTQAPVPEATLKPVSP